MDELDDGGQLVVIRPDRAGGPPGQRHQHRAQALAAGRDDVVRDLVDQHHVRGQPAPDQGVDGGHVRRGEGLDLGQGQGGTRGFDDGHGKSGREVPEL
jgi:hypothetical protein